MTALTGMPNHPPTGVLRPEYRQAVLSEALTLAIRGPASDPTRRAAMGRRGRAYVARFFDRAELAREYCKLLDEPGGRA